MITPSPDLNARKRELLMMRLKRGAAAAQALAAPALALANRGDTLPLSFAQQRLWFLDRLDGAAGAAYHLPGALRLTGRLHKAALRAALDRIVARHEILRTTFAGSGSAPVQVVGPADSGFPLAEQDLGRLDAAGQEQTVARIAAEEMTLPFSLEKGPLVRGRLLRLRDDEHILLVTQHHIVSDGWSIGVMVRELGALYAAFSQGRGDPLEPLPLQYADYAAWQRAHLQGEVLAAQSAFWKAHLDGAPTLLSMPTDRPRPARQSYAGASLTLDLPAPLTAALRALGQRHGSTMFMVMMAGWSALLGRMAGQQDVVVGMPVANRRRTEFEGLIGFFVNTLALRVRLADDPTVADLLQQVKASTLGAYDNQDLPFEQVVELVQPVRSMSHGPLFQVMLNMSNAPGGALELPGLTLGEVEQVNDTAQFDLSLMLTDAGDRIACNLNYATALFDAASMARLLVHFEVLLNAMAADDGMRVSALPLLSDAQRGHLLSGLNDTAAPVPDRLIHQLFEAQAAKQPEAIALSFEETDLSYGELNARANQVAHHLLALGVGPDDRVALCVERGPRMLAGLLGVLKAGAGYVPLDPGFPAERLAYMLGDCAPAALVSESALAAAMNVAAVPQVLLDEDGAAIAARPVSNPDVAGVTAAHLAYVIYTSGSTGLPKGVMIEHGAVVNFLTSMAAAPGIARDDVLLAVTTLSFDIAGLELYLPLANGARIVLASRDVAGDAVRLAAAIDASGATVMQATPATWRMLLAGGWRGAPALKVLCGGEALPPDLAAQLLARSGALWNVYGPTETTIWSTCRRVTDTAESIGRPIANTQVYILDAHLQPVPLGATGEIYIGGAGVARGYFARPELTAQRFIADPFGAAGGRLYKTGDLGRWLDNGEIACQGRNDFQVKVRGFRIELGEIEARLLACGGVREAVVVARRDGDAADPRLVAYLIAQDGAALEPAALRSALLAGLADYMVPSAYVVLDAFPLTPNNKIDRNALPAPDGDAVVKRAYAAPQGEVETAIAAIWQELLHLEQVGRDDNFFELGGHSLLIGTMIEQLRARGVHVTLRDVFTAPTVSAVAQAAGAAGAHTACAVPANLIGAHCDAITPAMLPLVALTQAEIDSIAAIVAGGMSNIQDIYPLSPLQSGMLYHHMLDSGSDPYVMRSVLSFGSRSQLDSFLDGIQQVIGRHDILRTGVIWKDLAMPVQVVARHASLPIQWLDHDGDDARTALAALLAHTDPQAYTMDLRHAPLLAACAVADAACEEWHLALLHHHLVCDHVTLGFIQAEIMAFMQGQGAGLAAALPYRDFIARTLAIDTAAHQAYFHALLADIDEPTAPFGLLKMRDDMPAQSARLDLAPDIAARIGAGARRHGVTPAVLFHAAWAQVAGQCSGRDDVVFGTVLSGRMQGADGAVQVLGMFVNTLPVRFSLAAADAADTVAQAYRQLTGLMAHEQASLALAQRCSAVAAPAPLFTSLLNYRRSAATAGTATDLPPALCGIRTHAAQERANYPFTVSIDEVDGQFSIAAQCVGVDAARVAALLAEAVAGLVTALEAASPAPLRSLSILPAGERAAIDAFNATAAPFPHDQLIQHVFEAQARARSDAIALAGEEDLSYGALNARANRLAHHLLALGVKADDRVALCMQRSTDMVVALLAILKAGAGYVPLDPAYPAERLAFMLDDCAPAALLTCVALADRLPRCGAPCVLVDADAAAIAGHPDDNPDVEGLSPSSLAYVIYTSGSTGRPNGVQVVHRNVLRLAVNGGFAPLAPDDCVAHCASPSFDASTWEIWGALLNGARVLLVPQPVLLDPARFSRCLVEGGVTALWLTAGLFNEYVDALAPAFARLTYLLVGGDALDPRTVRRALEREQRPRHLINGYGPTETTTFATTFPIAAVPDNASSLPIGRPISNTQVHILDRWLQTVPVGVAGEIYIGGEGVARGYLNREALTAERFIPDPFSGVAGARLYKTGDLGRWRADGTIDYLGRSDFQVKIRGFRIELGEIEAALAKCAGVREAVVLAREDQPGEKRLVAYLIAQDGAALEPAALRAALSASLADYMIPGAFVTLAAFPLTPNGKLDRRALPRPDAAAAAARSYAAPQGATEEAVAAIWQDLLALERVGRDDHFFELGGHSLMAVQMIGRIRQERGVEVNLRDLFDRPSLSGFARTVDAASTTAHAAIGRVARGAPLPVSFSQQRLWFLDQLDHAAGAAYHIPAALRLSGRLDRRALRATLDRIVARHENLRTVFTDADGKPMQAISPAEAGFALVEHDLGALSAAQQQAEVERLVAFEAGVGFDLERGPLVRGRLLRLRDDAHVLLVTQHHIVSDGWSIGVLVREMSILYAAFSEGQEDPLPALAIQYADYAAWQRGWLQGEVLQRQTAFWTAHLSGAPTLLDLPTDWPRPARQSHAGAGAALKLSPQLSAALRTLSQRQGTTLFMTLLAGWAALLARISGQDDVVIGTPVANRQRAETEPLIGFFVNTLALRVRFDGTPTVAQLLAQVKASTLGAYAHQDLPFDQVVEALQPPRSMSYAPLFQAMLSMNNTPRGGGLALSGLTIEAIEQARTTAHFDLSLALNDDGECIDGSLTYATDLFGPTSMRRLLAQFETLLAAMAADCTVPVGRLALLDGDQHDQLLRQFNDTAADYPHDQLIHRLFEVRAVAQPDALALECEGRGLTYAELNAQANQLAHHLIALGVRPDQRVALCLDRSLGMVVSLLAVLKAGAAYVPLDPAYPAERLVYMLGDCAPAVVVTESGLAGRLQAGTVPLVLVDADGAAIARRSRTNPDPAALGLHAGHLAYVIYTSGSTGRPKGVMVEHRSVVNLWQGLARSAFLHVPAQARIGFNAAISFDASVKNVVQLLSGHCLVLIPQALRADAAAMLAWFDRNRIDVFDCTPSQLEAMCRAGMLDDARGRKRVIVIGGEAIAAPAWQALQQAGVRAYNVYGPTECTVDATLACIPEAGPVPHLGTPMPNVRIYILDRHLQPVPLGAAGEIHIAGAGVARGYLNRPELTAERFIDDPFCAEAGGRMYRTGDLGRWLPDGTIAYLGRNDYQVKVRGYRIELGEIEAALSACAGVRQALVLARTDAPGDQRLVAYVSAHAGATLQAGVLRSALQERLADYMVPAAFVVLNAFPLTPNNKVDRAALPRPGQDAVASRVYVAPQGALENAIGGIWQQLLGLAQVGRGDHFFELGGHSLMAVQVQARLRQALGIEVGLRELFNHPVLADFAQAAARAARSLQGSIAPAGRAVPLPLSFAQQRLWFLDRLDHASGAAFHMPAGLRLRGRLDVAALQAALDRIVARHESLRTSFACVDGQAVQVFADPDCGFALGHHSLDHLDGHEREMTLALAVTDETSCPFMLETGPLVRGRLLRLGEEEHVLLVTQHHIVSDGWSTGVLVRELAALYTAFSQGRADPLAPLAIQYADYAAWQRAWLSGEVLAAQTGFWTEHLNGAPALIELPTDRTRPPAQSFAGGSVEIELPADVCAGVRALGQRHGATPFMTLMAAWASVLARLSGQDDIVIGTPVANRQRAETEDLIGFFVNTLALRVRPQAHLSVTDLLAQVKASTLGAFEHQDIPFDLVVEALQPVRSMSYGPLFQVMFTLNNTPAGETLRLPGLALEPAGQDSALCQFDLVLALTERDGRIGGRLSYATDLFDAATASRFAACFTTLLAAMVAGDGQRLDALPLLDAGMRRQLLVDFNGEGVPFARAVLAHQLFEEQAAARPDAVALVFEEREISYAQLNRRANQVAQRLLQLGVRPDARVAICVERGPELIVGMLGILKAGAGYVPLDPAYPEDRLQFMLSDSAPAALVTQGTLACRLDAGVPVLKLDADAALLAAQPDENPAPDALGLHEGHLAYMIYTSGSTGMPKGVQNQHDGLVNLIHTQRAGLDIDTGSRVLQFVSMSFDVCISEVTMALCNGACLVLASAADLAPGEPLLATVRRHRVSHLSMPSAVLGVLPQDADIGALRTLIVGGDAMPPALADHWSSRCTLFNAYGPTEAAVCTAMYRCSAPHGAVVPIGRPTDNTRMYVLDAAMQPVSVGVAGELYIGGAQVARGYLNRPELTAGRFLPDPFSDVPGARMYRSGDLCRWTAAGLLEYVGRNDFQVKIRGFRIELGEIETRLAACDGVHEALVLARQDGPGEKVLVAYAVARPGAQLAPVRLREALAAQLPAHMVPVAVVVLDAFPRTANGKHDRKALPAPDYSAAAGRAYEAPEGATETGIARIWQSLLGRAQVGRNDSFFELGGHSLMAVQLVARMERELGLDTSLRALFVHPTLRAFATAARRQAPANSHSLVPIRPDGILKPLFLIHPGEGEIGYARELAPLLDAQMPVYGLAAQGFAKGEVPFATVEEMAAHYVSQMRQVQPHGPYRVAGWSAGGTIAYEIANQLVGADERVEFLGLIDTSSDYQALAGGVFGMRGTVTSDFEAWVGALAWLPAGVTAEVLARLRRMADDAGIDAMLAAAQDAALLPAGIDVPTLRRHLAVRHGIAVAMYGYVLPTIPVPVSLFSASGECRADTSIGWAGVLGARLNTISVPGTHYSLMQAPHIAHLGSAIDAEMRRAADRAVDYAELNYSPKVAIQFGRRDVAPLFCVPGAGASVTAFTDLAQTIDPAIPVYGLQPRGLCGTMVPHIDVQSAARAYVRTVREVQPHGPYRLLGHSYGGWVVTEMARQLVAAGETIATLVVLDSQAPAGVGSIKKHYKRVEVLMRLVGLFEEKLQQSLALEAADFDGMSHDAQLALLLERLIEAGALPPRTRVHTLRGIVRAFGTNINTRYAPEYPYDGTLHLAAATPDRAARTGRTAPDELAALWRRQAPKSRLWTSKGNHMTLLARPHVHELGNWLAPLMKEI